MRRRGECGGGSWGARDGVELRGVVLRGGAPAGGPVCATTYTGPAYSEVTLGGGGGGGPPARSNACTAATCIAAVACRGCGGCCAARCAAA